MQAPFARSSLNHDDVFILDTERKIYQFNGANSNIQERAKALEVIQFLKEKYHDGMCDVAIVGKALRYMVLYCSLSPKYFKAPHSDLLFMHVLLSVLDDGKLDTESDSGEFWVLFGGFAPIGKKAPSEDDVVPEKFPAKLYR